MSDKRSGSEMAFLIKEIKSLINQSFRNAFKGSGLTPPQMMVMGMLHKHKKLKISDISKEMSLANSTVSGIIDRLEKQELVKRVRSQEDKRIVYIELTEKSNSLKDKFDNVLNNHFDEIVSDSSNEELDTIFNGLETLRDVLKRHN